LRQILDHAGLEALDPPAGSVGGGGAQGRAILVAGDEGGKAGFDLLPHQLGVVVLVEIAQAQQHRREPGHAAHLARPLPLEQVQHAARRHRLAGKARAAKACDLPGVDRVEPIGAAPAERVELDALQDEAAIREIAGAAGVEMIGLQHLQLERHRQAVLEPRSRRRTSTSPLSAMARTASACRP
jgi:hypothetical protein